MQSFHSLTVKELINECKSRKIGGYSGKKKAELIQLLTNGENCEPLIQSATATVTTTPPKPLLKWVGGKTQLLDRLMAEFPRDINNYREIFLGGGSVLLALLASVRSGVRRVHGNIYAYDGNEALIYFYKNIQERHQELFENLQQIIEEFNQCGSDDGNGEINRAPTTLVDAMVARENYYYWIRRQYNQLSVADKRTPRGSALFLFLNKTCFRGVFRMGPNGFNVPYGHYDCPEIINRQHLEEVHQLIQGVIFECRDFSDSLRMDCIEEGDFLYLDPPYAPETDTSFVGYTKDGFTQNKHLELFARVHELTDNHIAVLFSNADVPLIRTNFVQEKYKITSVICKRTIHSKNPGATAKEVIIQNY